MRRGAVPKAPSSQGLSRASVLSQGHSQSPEESWPKEGSGHVPVSPWNGPGGAACEAEPEHEREDVWRQEQGGHGRQGREGCGQRCGGGKQGSAVLKN